MNLLIAIVENHLTRIDVIDGIFAGAMHAAAEVIIEEAVEYIVVIEDKLICPNCSSVIFFLLFFLIANIAKNSFISLRLIYIFNLFSI